MNNLLMNNLLMNSLLKKALNIFSGKKYGQYELQYLKDDSGHCVPYVFKAAKNKNSPLLVLFHGHSTNVTYGKYMNENYNIVCPLDRYGYDNYGCWFMGENGKFFMLEILSAYIRQLLSRDEIKNELYLWGSSMGGYAAMVYGIILKAHAVFSHVPQTNLYNSAWYKRHRKTIDFIFGDDKGENIYRNIIKLIDLHIAKLPLFFLSFNRFDTNCYNQEHLNPLINFFNEKKINYGLFIHPQVGHKLYQRTADHLTCFDLYKKEIMENYNKK